jgi:DNA polymerase-4
MPPSSLRRIAHLDMDAFFASVELLRYPELRGKPVVIGGGKDRLPHRLPDGTHRFSSLAQYVGRGVVTTCTYPARTLGVHSAMGMMKAAALAPHAVVLPVDFEAYRAASRAFKAAVRAITPCVEDRGVDEIYIDLSDTPGAAQDGGRAMAHALQHAVHAATGLTCSVGVAPNKLLAKICSDLEKPNGQTILQAEDIPTRIWPLAASKVNGIGPKANDKLAALGIHTIGDLAQADQNVLISHFGKGQGVWMHRAAWGQDDAPVVTHSEPVSISRETTFDRDLHAVRDRESLSPILTNLCSALAADLLRKGYAAKTFGIKLRFSDFKSATRDVSLSEHTSDASDIRRAAGQCLKRVDLTRKLRLLGVRASGLERISDLVMGHAQTQHAVRTTRPKAPAALQSAQQRLPWPELEATAS